MNDPAPLGFAAWRRPWSSPQFWMGLGVILAALAGGCAWWFHFQQRAAVVRQLERMGEIQRIRRELVAGFARTGAADWVNAPAQRRQDVPAPDAAVASLRRLVGAGEADPLRELARREALRNLERSAADLRVRLAMLPGDRSPTDEENAGVAAAFQQMDRAAERVAQVVEQQWGATTARLDRRFVTALVIGGVLLLACGGLAHRAHRSSARDVRSPQVSADDLQRVLQNLAGGVVVCDGQGKIVFWNDAARALHGIERREQLRAQWADCQSDFQLATLDGAPLPFEAWPIVRLLRGETVRDVEVRVRRAGRESDRVISCSGAMLRDADSRELAVMSIADITQRRLAEAESRNRERLLNDTGRLVQVGGWEFDPVSGRGSWTEEVARIHDLDPAHETSKALGLQFYHGQSRQRIEAAVKEAIERGTPYDLELELLTAKGVPKWVRTICQPLVEQGKVVRVRGAFQDITARKEAELRTTTQHAVTDVLAEAGALPLAARRILEIICRSLGWDVGDFWIVDRTLKKLRCVEVWHPQSTEFVEFVQVSRALVFALDEGLPGRVWTRREPIWLPDVTQDEKFVRRDLAARLGLHGAIAFPIRLRGEVLGVMELFSAQAREPDAALLATFATLGTQIGQFIERTQLEEQFRQAQKMEAIGTLAGGIAHDFNNILAAIIGYTEVAKADRDATAAVRENLEAVLEASRRATDLVRQILAFSRMQDQQRKPVQLRHVVAEARKLLRATIPATIEFESALAADAPAVLADPSQIHQVLINLCTNAAHAMHGGPGRLGFRLEGVEVSEDFAAMHAGLRAGRYARLSISDTGHGMDHGTLSRIFEPFFTTKAPGEGTGLGLSVVHGIIKNHDGAIAVYSQPGEGTRFDIYLPAHTADVVESIAKAVDVPMGRGERVLIVDDEPLLARMGKKVLGQLGYEVEAQTDVAVALQMLQANPSAYDLVITDLTMPGMTGLDLAQRLLALRPDLPIILTTGYTATLTPERVRAMGIRDLLLKPLSVETIGLAVRRVLEASTPANETVAR